MPGYNRKKHRRKKKELHSRLRLNEFIQRYIAIPSLFRSPHPLCADGFFQMPNPRSFPRKKNKTRAAQPKARVPRSRKDRTPANDIQTK